MQADYQQPWKLNIQAKANKFHLKLKTHKLLLPSCKFFQFSLKFKIRNFLIRVKSQPQPSFASKLKSTNSKFIQAIKELQIRRSNKAISRGSNNGDKSYLGGHLSRLYETISRNDRSGIIKFGSMIMMFLASRFYNYFRRKRFSLSLVIIGMLISGTISPKTNVFTVVGGYMSNYLSKAKVTVPLLEFIFTFLQNF
ncbi:hypothetical protein LIER_43136 [Lithospermum erythrorhizon]|uniref:Uncharacterized protein n=1 Tax=Lithospermum erythrorhizon TaxID=34254 RepID=A0AAV3PIT7_LITER